MTELAPLTNVPLPVKLRLEDYLLLDEAGAFDSYGRTELLDGEIAYMNAQHRPHARVKMALYDALREGLKAARSGLAVFVETSVALGRHDSPEPDLTVTSEPDGAGLIPVGSVALVIEVADTTLRSDLTRKAAICARADMAEYCLGGVDEFEQVASGCNLDHAEEALGELVAAGGDGSVDLEMTKHALDAIAFLVEDAVVDDRLFTV